MEARQRVAVVLLLVAVVLCVLSVVAVYLVTRLGPPVAVGSPEAQRPFSRELVVDRIALLADGRAFKVRPDADDTLPRTLPIPAETDAGELERFRQDYRVLQLCRDLGKLGSTEATALLNELIPQYLSEYRPVLEACVTDDLGEPPAEGAAELDVRQQAQAQRYCLLALLLAAGNLELTGTHEAVVQVVRQALGQRERFYAPAGLDEDARFQLLAYRGLYQREILGYALLRTCPNSDLAQATLKSLGRGVLVKELWGVEDTLIRSQSELLPGPVDYTADVPEMRCLEPITDEELDGIVAAVLPPGNE